MNRIVLIAGFVMLAGGLLWRFPLFHIVRLDATRSQSSGAEFEADEFANKFWAGELRAAAEKAPEASEVLAALVENSPDARAKFGRKVGVSRNTLLLMRGTGEVVAVDDKGVGIALTPGSKVSDVVLRTALVFGNVVRDVTGEITAGEFSDSRQFNEVSVELNKIVETRVIPELKERAAVGKKISFAGCTEISDMAAVARPLAITPLEVSFE